MLSYMVRRLLIAIPTLLAVLTVIFLAIRVVPGDPAAVLMGEEADAATLQIFRERMGLDRPIWVQYADFLSGLVRGDLGRSMLTEVPVSSQVARALPYTLELTLAGMGLGILMGVPLGVFAALYRNRSVDYLSRTFSLIGQAIPSFYLALLFLVLFSLRLEWFPAIGGGERGDIRSLVSHLFLPALTLGIAKAAYVTRMARAAMLNVLTEDYIRTARAKGLKDRTVNMVHALRAALVPIISVIGVYSIITLGGSVMVEIVFGRPGLGRMMVSGMLRRDYTMLQSIMVIFAFFVVLINLGTDLLCGFADPRIRYD